MRPLAPRTAQALAFIAAELAAGRPFPSFDRIAEHMSWRHPTSANHCLKRLMWDGYLWCSGDGRYVPLRYMRVTDGT